MDLEESLLVETTFGKVAEGAGETEPGFAHGLGDVFPGECIEGGRGERSQGQTVGHKEVGDDGVGAVRADEGTLECERFAEQHRGFNECVRQVPQRKVEQSVDAMEHADGTSQATEGMVLRTKRAEVPFVGAKRWGKTAVPPEVPEVATFFFQ